MFRSLLFIAILSLAVTTSCSKDNDDDGPEDLCGVNWSPAVELQDELNALSAAINAYGLDPTTANCNAYKQAYLDYLNAIKEWEECYIYVGQQQEFLQAVEEAEQEVNDIEC
jgi:hypothetical protein